MLAPRKYRRERKAVFSYIKNNPYSTIAEITKAMGWDGYYGMGIEVFCILNQLYRWGIIRKFCLYVKDLLTIEELREEIETRKIYSLRDVIKLAERRRIVIMKEIKEKGWHWGEMRNALHASGVTTFEEFLRGENKREELIFVYKVKEGILTELKFHLFNLCRKPTWR